MIVHREMGRLISMNFSYITEYLLYNIIGNHLPKSDAKINFGVGRFVH